MYTVIGIERKQGVYEGNSYDNTILHVTYTNERAKDLQGVCVTTFKVKTNNVPPLALGDLVVPLYDRYGNVSRLDVSAK